MIKFIAKFNAEEMQFRETDTYTITEELGSGFVHQDPQNVIEVQADGDELVALLTQCYYLVQTKRLSQRWFGDHAKFIAANLKL